MGAYVSVNECATVRCMCVCVCMSMCTCVCVWERESVCVKMREGKKEKNFHRIRHSSCRRHLKNKGGNFEQFVDLRDALFDEFSNFNAFIKTFQNNYPFPFQSFFLLRWRWNNLWDLVLLYGLILLLQLQSERVTMAKLKLETCGRQTCRI